MQTTLPKKLRIAEREYIIRRRAYRAIAKYSFEYSSEVFEYFIRRYYYFDLSNILPQSFLVWTDASSHLDSDAPPFPKQLAPILYFLLLTPASIKRGHLLHAAYKEWIDDISGTEASFFGIKSSCLQNICRASRTSSYTTYACHL